MRTLVIQFVIVRDKILYSYRDTIKCSVPATNLVIQPKAEYIKTRPLRAAIDCYQRLSVCVSQTSPPATDVAPVHPVVARSPSALLAPVDLWNRLSPQLRGRRQASRRHTSRAYFECAVATSRLRCLSMTGLGGFRYIYSHSMRIVFRDLPVGDKSSHTRAGRFG